MKNDISRKLILAVLLLGLPVMGLAKATGVSSKLPPEYILDKISGSVFVLSKGSTKPEAAEEEQTVQAGDEITTRANSDVSLTLNDSTVVQISGDSDVKVGELSRQTSGSFISRLSLAAGKILSQVEKLGKSQSVFEVEAGGVVCGVRGTAFEVQKDGTLVATNTFEGVVEMKKENITQAVPADKHSEFATDKGQFLQQRVLSDRERARYENWRHFRDLVARRQMERQAALKAFDTLPSAEQDQLWKGLQQVRDRDRFKVIRQMMREKNHQDRLKVIDRAAQARVSAVNNRQETMRKAQEQRERELKALKERKKE